MHKNTFSSKDGGHIEETIQNHVHLSEKTTDELTDSLIDMWDTIDENTYDPQKVDAYLNELERIDPIPSHFDVENTLDEFHHKHARLIGQASPAQFSTRKKSKRRFWLPSSFAAVIVIAMLGGAVTASALGFNIFSAIAQWTEETFNYSFFSDYSDNPDNTPSQATGCEFATLQEAVNAYGIVDKVVPQWFPAGLSTVKVNVTPRRTGTTFQALYESEQLSINVSIRHFMTAEDAQISVGTFEKDSDDIVRHEYDGIMHYIFSNNSNNTATWLNNELVCSISGNLSVDELKSMINSIYEG